MSGATPYWEANPGLFDFYTFRLLHYHTLRAITHVFCKSNITAATAAPENAPRRPAACTRFELLHNRVSQWAEPRSKRRMNRRTLISTSDSADAEYGAKSACWSRCGLSDQGHLHEFASADANDGTANTPVTCCSRSMFKNFRTNVSLPWRNLGEHRIFVDIESLEQ